MYNTFQDTISYFNKIRILILLGALIGLLSIFNPLGIIAPFFIVFFGFLLLCLAALFYEKDDFHFLFKILIISLFVRLLITLLLYNLAYLKHGHGFFLGADDYGFSFNASRILQTFRETGHIPQNGSLDWMPTAGNLNYTYFLCFLYFFIEENPLIPLFLNCLVATCTVFFVYSIASQVFGRSVARLTALFTAFWPSFLFWSTQNLKEPLTIFLICVALWAVTRIFHKFHFIYVLIIIISIFLLSKLRLSVSFWLFLAVFVSLFLSTRVSRLFIAAIFMLIFISIIYTGYWTKLYSLLLHKLSYYLPVPLISDKVSIFKIIDAVRQAKMVGANTAILKNFEISNFYSFLAFLPLGLAFTLFAPFPWQITTPGQLLAGIEMLLWYILIPFTIKGLIVVLQNRAQKKEIKAIIIFLIISLIVLSLFEGNIGTLFRHRAFIWPFCFIFTSVGINVYLKKYNVAEQ